MAADFLSALKRKRFGLSREEGRAGVFFFQIVFDEGGLARVRTVDASGQLTRPEGRVSNPAVAGALDVFRSPDRELQGWGRDHTELVLADCPQLSFMLMQCDNVVDEQMRTLLYDPALVSPILRFDSAGPGELKPRVVVEGDDGEARDAAFLTDSLVLVGRVLSPCRPVGENFRYMRSLLEPFAADLAETYLSVVLSALRNMRVAYSGRATVETAEAAEAPLPGLIFEKVDFDKALFLRVMSVIPGLSPELSADFDIDTVARITDDTVYLRHVRPMDMHTMVRDFEALLDDAFRTQKDRRAIYRDGSLFVLPYAQASQFLMKMVPRLVREYTILGAEKLREFKIQAARPKLNVSLGAGIDFLEGEATVDFGEERLTLAELLKQYRRNKYIELSDGSRALVEDSYIRRLERIFRPAEGDTAAVEVSFFDIPGLEHLLGEGADLPAFEQSRKFYNGLRALPQLPYEAPGVHGELRPYQREGAKWMEYLGDNGFGACLADDMGLGKTIQTIALLTKVCVRPEATTVLIVMPRSLLFNWGEELRRFAPELSVAVYHGLNRDFDEAMKAQVVLTTYAMVRNDVRLFMEREFEYIILDESQNIKNITSQTTRAVLALKGRSRLALSGTPMENNLLELYSLFRFLNPRMFGSPEEFNQRYAGPIQREGDPEAMEALRRRIFPFILRRLKRDVLDDLPERVDETLYVEMDLEQRRLYERRRQYYRELVDETIRKEGVHRSQFVMFQAMSELRRIASVPESLSDGRITSPKLELLVEQVEKSVANGHKVVVFFNFIAGLELAGEQLRAAGIKTETMTGATTGRESVVRRFQTNPDCRVLLMTMKVGGVGLNLTAADIVYVFEPWWNKAAEEQAVNRLHRIGQKSTVFAYSMITHGTIEEKIRLLQERKTELFDGLISSDSTMSKALSEEDINFILS
ncbi:MAG: DEAD/DEAH box helicase family protein [Muribaculaceae bacterium]|nr:DEAD/DEAH box helicase family protein [Muribaculaceae bacterium]